MYIVILSVIIVLIVLIFGLCLIKIFESLSKHKTMIDFIDDHASRALKVAHNFNSEYIRNYFNILRDWKEIRERKLKEWEKEDKDKDEERLQETWKIIEQTAEIKKDIKKAPF